MINSCLEASCTALFDNPFLLGYGIRHKGGKLMKIKKMGIAAYNQESFFLLRAGDDSWHMGKRMVFRRLLSSRSLLWSAPLIVLLLMFSCASPEKEPLPLTAERPLHFEEHIDLANIVGSEVPKDIPTAVECRFDQPQPDWRPMIPLQASVKPLTLKRTKDALQLTLTEVNKFRNRLRGGIFIDLPDWRREDWAYILVCARTTDKIGWISVGFNLRKKPGTEPWEQGAIIYSGEYVDVIKDGSVQTYLMRADWSWGEWEGPWKQLIITTGSEKPATLDILSISVIPKEANYAKSPVGVSTEVRSEAYRRTLFTHAPSKLEYRVRVPKAGRLDVGLGVLREDAPVTFRITATPEGDESKTLLEEDYADKGKWAQRSVDLSSMTGKTVTLGLEADSERAGTVAFWAAPTLTGARNIDKPNNIFYVIDGAAADYMSVYGYNRLTTPNINRLAAEGAIFKNGYSNSSWTKISTPSFMTSLHNIVLGSYKNDTDPLPEQAVPMAQYMHNAGY